jgi:protein involved in ribonucleotide reduction
MNIPTVQAPAGSSATPGEHAVPSPTLVYFTNYSGNTQRFITKVVEEAQATGHDIPVQQIPIHWDDENPLTVNKDYILVVPTYGGGSDKHAVPRQVVKFLNLENNRNHLVGIVGTGNTNFGADYCKAAHVIAKKTGAPILNKIEILGTPTEVTATVKVFTDFTTR